MKANVDLTSGRGWNLDERLAASDIMYRKRTFSSSETRGERDLTNLAESETGDELRGFQVCSSSTVDELRSLSIHSVHALHSKWKACCSSHHTVVKKCSSQINEQSRDHRVASLSSKDVSWLQTDKRCIKTQARHKISHHFTSQQANNCNSTEQTNHSQFPKSSNNSLRSKKPPVICKSIQHSTAFLRIFTRFLFAMVLFASLISPSLSSPSISVPSLTSPNLKSWKMVALKTVDYGTESEMNSHRVPIPDVTAIVGRLFRFQIPESAFSERPSVFKAIRAGSRELPTWLHFDETIGQFTGVPLQKDKGQIYISVDGHVTRENRKVLTEGAIFSLTVLPSSVSINASTVYRSKYPDHDDKTLASGCDHSIETRLVECSPGEEWVLANVLFLFSFDSLTPLERAELFVNSALLFDTCLERLELRVVNWTNTEGVWLWSKLASGEIIDTLESATILSFRVGCENFDPSEQSPILKLLSRSTDICREGLLLSDKGYVWVTCHQWFVTAGTKLFLSHSDVSDIEFVEDRKREKRQLPGVDGPDFEVLPFPPSGGDDDSVSTMSIESSSASVEMSFSTMQSSSVVSQSISSISSLSNSPMPTSRPQIGIRSSVQPSSTGVLSSAQSSPAGRSRVSSAQSVISSSQMSSVSSTQLDERFGFIQASTPVGTSLASSLPDSTALGQLTSTSLSFLAAQPSSSQLLHVMSSLADSSRVPAEVSTPILSQQTSSIPADVSRTKSSFSSAEEDIPLLRVTPSSMGEFSSLLVAATPMTSSLIPSGLLSVAQSTLEEVAVYTRFPFSSRLVGSQVTLLPTPTPQSSTLMLPTSSSPSMSSSQAFSSVENIVERTRMPFLTISSSQAIDVERPPGETTAVVMVITPSLTASRPSFSIPSTIEVLASSSLPTSAAQPSPSIPNRSSFDILPTETILISLATSDILGPLPSTTPMIDFSSSFDFLTTIAPTPVRTTNILMPLPTSELSPSMSMFTPSSFPPATSSIFLPIFTSMEMIASESPIPASSFPMSSFFVISPTPAQSETTSVSSVLLEISSSDDFIFPLPTPTPSITSSALPVPSSVVPTPVFSSSPSQLSSAVITQSISPSFSLPTSSFVFFISSSESLLIPFPTPVPSVNPSVPISISSQVTLSISPSSLLVSPSPVSTCEFVDCNYGECIDLGGGEVTCECFDGYTGILCETPIVSLSSMRLSLTTSIEIESMPMSSVSFFISSSESLLVPFPTPILSSVSSIPVSFNTASVSKSLLPSSIPMSPTPVSLCDFVKCINGECMTLESGGVTCVCIAGFTGPFCEIPLIPSSSTVFTFTPTPTPPLPTQTSSSLMFLFSSSENLLVPFTSSVMQSISTSIPIASPSPSPICDIVDCNNGTCMANELGENFTCLCFPGWTGRFCDIPLISSVLISPSPVLSQTIRATSLLSFTVSTLEDILFPMTTSAQLLTPSSIIVSPSPTVTNVSACNFVNCMNGVCIDFGGNFVMCECFLGWTGIFCEVPIVSSSSMILTLTPSPSPPTDVCDMIDCNNGSCVAIDSGVNFTCECFAGWTGEFCDIPILIFVSSSESVLVPFPTPVLPTPSPTANISACDFVNCTNGECVEVGDNIAMCECFVGWTGEFCDMPLPTTSIVAGDTNSIPIPTSSFLFLIPNSESVLVPFPTPVLPTPSPTANISACDFVNCMNGECIEVGDMAMCECFLGWTGIFCEVPIVSSSSMILNLTPSPSPPIDVCDMIDCNNGSCVAIDSGVNFTCECFAGWTGEFCDVRIPLPMTSFVVGDTISMPTPSSILFLVPSSESVLVPFPTPVLPTPSPTANISACDFVNCTNGACVEVGDDMAICECFAGWTGEFCDMPLPTTSIVAVDPNSIPIPTSSVLFLIPSSESVLVPFPTPMLPTPSPTSNISACDFVNCTNGECTEVGDDMAICECFVGWTGEFCDMPLPTTSIVAGDTNSIPIPTSSVLFLVPSSESVLVPFQTPVLPTPSPTANISACDFVNCTNGECIEVGDNIAMCECFVGWTGEFCDMPLPTTSFVVGDTISTSSVLFFVSSSESVLVPFQTPVLPTPSSISNISACDFVNCTNGECIEVGDDMAICECFVGWTGEFCDIQLPMTSFVARDTNSIPIPTSSILFLVPSSESVLVPFPTPVFPTPSPTANISVCDFINCTNGECIEVGDDMAICECFLGWTGIFCEVPIVSSSSMILTLTPSPSPPIDVCDMIDCNNGSCIAIDSGLNFTCECFAGWTGEFCDIRIPLPMTSFVVGDTISMPTPSSILFLVPSSESVLVPFLTPILPTSSPTANISLCDFVNCTNGDCIEVGDDITMCECFPGWTGMFCNTPLPSSSFMFILGPTQTPSPSPMICELINCNNGTCVADDFGTNITCDCFVGWTGEFCDFPLPPTPICDTVNCSGNGECTNLEEGFSCSCYVGWTGGLCEIDIDFCEPDTYGNCNQTGTLMCIDGNSTQTCVCVLGFTGDLCSIDIDDCDPDPCFNNATCINSLFGNFSCKCAPGFTGILCNESITPCDPNPCMEPEEMCIAIGPEEDDFMCIALPMTTTTTAHISTMVSLVPSSIPVSLSPTPIPTPVPPNSPPRVLNPIGTLIANEGQVTHFAIPELTFYDPESGSTSNLTLSLLNFNGNELQNTTWIHITNGAIQVLPLRDQAVTDLVSEHTFILRASDELGASTHDFVTVRLLRQRVNFQNFLVVFMEGSFAMFNETLQDKISLAQGLSVHISNTSIANVTSTENIYIKAFRNGSIAAVYRDISIPDTHCADFASWVETVYFDSSYSPSFIRSLAYYRFVPTSIPVIEGPCNSNDTVTNPTVAMTQRIPPGPRSDLILFLATVVPTVAVACLGLVVGMILFATYHSRRSEREKLTTRNVKNMFTHRRPVILDEEWDLPNRRRRPVILPGDRGLAPRSPVVIDGGRGTRPLLEELDYGGESDSSDDAPGLSLARTNRYSAMSPDPVSDDDPPPYVPPL